MITAPESMLGRYLQAELERHQNADLENGTIFHCAGTEEEAGAMEKNYEATRRLLSGLEEAPPANIVYASSWQVYSPDAGEGVTETRPTFARSEAGRSKARTEMLLERWCREHGVCLTIVRPALMFGTGIDGAMLRLFNRAIRGHYVHLRGNKAKVSLVTALDAARAMVALAGKPGVYNLSDGRAHTWLELVESMTANAGARKRMTHLPEKWAAFIYKWFGRLPIVEECLSPAALEPLSLTCVLDNSKVTEVTGMRFFDTAAVIARTEKDYPYGALSC